VSEFFVRELDPDMGTAVANRTYLRKYEKWPDLAKRVALGNSLLHSSGKEDREALEEYICNASFLTAGRHLQHGDENQPNKNIEIHTNCSTACTSFLEFLLLLNGSGVGRNYSDEFMTVDWQNMPHLYCVLSSEHDDYQKQFHPEYTPKLKVTSREDYASYPGNPDLYHVVEDSREGWAKALEILEVAAFEKKRYDHYVFDFSLIRKYGTPIKGMQNRPASGPLPLIYAFQQAAKVKYIEGMMPWMQTMIIDHFMAECVVNGGARRSARIAVKYWKDKEISKFVTIKRDNPGLWSSNNSVGVDAEFWEQVDIEGSLAESLFNEITKSSFQDMTGEPGLINLDKLTIK
jgi:hypothetical protein